MTSIFDIAEQHRRQVAARERESVRRMISAYGQVYGRVQDRLAVIQSAIQAAQDVGEEVNASWLFQEQRLQLLERLVENEVSTFARFAGGAIEDEQRYLAQLGQEHVREMVLFGLDPLPQGATVAFSYLPTTALESLVGFLSDGSPLSSLLDELGPDASKAVRSALLQAVGTGIGPRQTARMIREALGGNLTRALTIARTEQLRALRESSHLSAARNSDITKNWVWHASMSPRTCMACISQHGTVHPISERMASHVNCRCSAVYQSVSWASLGFSGIEDTSVQAGDIKRGSEWFSRQDASTQERMMGQAKFAAWEAGALRRDLSDLVGVKRSRLWGNSVFERSLKDILGEDEALRWRREARVG